MSPGEALRVALKFVRIAIRLKASGQTFKDIEKPPEVEVLYFCVLQSILKLIPLIIIKVSRVSLGRGRGRMGEAFERSAFTSSKI